MTRRRRRPPEVPGLLITIGGAAAAIGYVGSVLVATLGAPLLAAIAAAILLMCAWIRRARQRARKRRRESVLSACRASLMAKYGDAGVVRRIMEGQIWQGQTAGQLADALGKPVDVDEGVTKGRRHEVWKYHPVGSRRFALRVTLEDAVVIGWEEKG